LQYLEIILIKFGVCTIGTNAGASSPNAGGHNPVFIQQWYLSFSSKQGKTPKE
jgi:hypothetical protein